MVAPELRASLHLSDAQIGLVASLAGAAGAICALPAGTLVDRRHRTVVLTVALVVWSLGFGLSGFAVGFALLAVSRVVSGGVATIARPVSISLAGDIYRPANRGWALARLDAGQAAGVGLCYLLGALAVHALTWRWLFWGLAAAGLVLGLGARRLHDPRPIRPPGPPLSSVLRTLLEIKTNVIVLAADSVGNFFFAGVASFAVLFVTERYGLSTATVDALAPIIGVGVIIGILAGGRVGDRIARGQGERRLTVAASSQLLATGIFAIALLQGDLASAGVLLFVGASVLGAAGPCLDAVRLDIMAPDIRGRGEAARGLLTLASSALGPVTFGLVATAFGGRGDLALRDAFLVMLIPLAVGALLLLTARRPYPADAARAGMLGT